MCNKCYTAAFTIRQSHTFHKYHCRIALVRSQVTLLFSIHSVHRFDEGAIVAKVILADRATQNWLVYLHM